ncbi:MAG: serine/threonine protein kinase [Leptolyngbya foveolarum]|uniref:non-specific serine/threonine protein kinase n=1 Tax=Leptolyngbya foveolarum TaxID=47253 RepID=A0A2W4TSL8_9CYAN|nr:MAG: serine/threonine protein kinase [Leptolyngbya foveolarum]
MTSSKDKALENTALLSNRYRVLSLLGDGGFGKTFLVEDVHMPSARQCVLKQLKPIEDDEAAGKIVRNRFGREAATLEKLGETHDQIPRLYAYFSEGDQFYLVTEWIAGYTLTQKVQVEGPQSEAAVKKIIADLLGVIAYVHRQGIVHRDIKPDNVILRRADGKPVLIDFGAVKETMTTQISVNGQGAQAHTIAIGTPGYMPAEQMAGRPTFTSDLYSLGMTAIYLLTSRIPQELSVDDRTGEWLWRQYASGVSAGFGNFLDCAIHRDPRTRFPSAESMLSILNTLIADDAQRTVAGFELSASAPEPTLAPSYQRATVASRAPLAEPSIAEPNGLYRPERDPTYEVPYEPTAIAQPPAKSGSWRNAIVIGSMVGCSVLLGVLLAMEKLPNLFNRSGAVVEAVDSQPDSGPENPPDQPVIDEPDEAASVPTRTVPGANGTVAGQLGSKNVRAKAGRLYAVVDAVNVGDRVKITQKGTDAEGNLWYEITTPNDIQGWIAGQLLQIDGNAKLPQTKPAPDSPTSPPDSGTDNSDSNPANTGNSTPATPTDETDAVLIGEAGSKNIRSGPGVSYGKVHDGFPGDRVIITNTDQDADGYTWYEISFPKSGAKGWVAAQLVKKD